MRHDLGAGEVQRQGVVSFRDNYVNLPNRTLHYVDYGGSGPVVLALHGLVQNAHAFDGIATTLVPGARLLALDLRGRGASDWGAAKDYQMSSYLRDLTEFCTALGLTRFSLIGSSLGGYVAMIYTLAHPSHIERLVLNDHSLHNNRDAVLRANQRTGRAPDRFADMAEALTWFMDEHDNVRPLDDEARLAWVSHFLVPSAEGGFRFNCDPFFFVNAKQIGLQRRPEHLTHRRLLREQASRLTMPVLLLRGGCSDVVPEESARATVDLLRNATSVDIPGVGHSPTLYEPAAREALRRFLS